MPDVRLRRIRLQTDDEMGRQLAYTIAPCDLLPYMTGNVSKIEKVLFLKQRGLRPRLAVKRVFFCLGERPNEKIPFRIAEPPQAARRVEPRFFV